jgi:hypothetical protein
MAILRAKNIKIKIEDTSRISVKLALLPPKSQVKVMLVFLQFCV